MVLVLLLFCRWTIMDNLEQLGLVLSLMIGKPAPFLSRVTPALDRAQSTQCSREMRKLLPLFFVFA